jgi:hypothetical protein
MTGMDFMKADKKVALCLHGYFNSRRMEAR